MPTQSYLGIIAGAGQLPQEIIDKAFINGELAAVVKLNEFLNLKIEKSIANKFIPIGQVGEIFAYLRQQKVKKLIFAGKLKRPNFKELKVDAVGGKWILKLGLNIFKGDDALLKALHRLIIAEGFEIIGAHEYLKNLTCDLGEKTTVMSPNESHLLDIQRGTEVLQACSIADIGQACIVHQGVVLGVEAAEGTDELIKRCVAYRNASCGGVLIKRAKLGQLETIDLPTVGLQTLKLLKSCAFDGISIQANKVQIIDKQQCYEYANQHGLFIDVQE